MKLSKIKPNPDNPRIVKDDKFKKLVKSIKEFPKMMELRPMVVDSNNIVLGGNMRLKALKELNYKEIPDSWVKRAEDLTEEETKRFIIADNVGFGSWDWETLANEWEEEQLIDWGLDIPDFDTEEELEAQEDDYSEPEQMQVDVIKGDLIEFVCDDGRVHRLLCGDSTDSDAVAKLMDGRKADMVFTDPPYNGKMGSGGFKNSPKLQKSKDALVDSIRHLYSFSPAGIYPILEAFKNPKISIFLFCNKNLVPNYLNFALESKRLFDILTWHKKSTIPANNNKYYPDTEYLIKIKDSGAVFNTGLGDVVNYGKYWLLNSPQADQKEGHPTVKPQEIIKDCILICSKKGQLILDLFLGSGSTLVAAHQLKRVCFGMELDEKYCQVIIDRMQKLDNTLTVKINGKEYKKEAENVPF